LAASSRGRLFQAYFAAHVFGFAVYGENLAGALRRAKFCFIPRRRRYSRSSHAKKMRFPSALAPAAPEPFPARRD
jgi:hypothetical protein